MQKNKENITKKIKNTENTKKDKVENTKKDIVEKTKKESQLRVYHEKREKERKNNGI